MRIAFGALKGRRFSFRCQTAPRPTAGVVKEAFFSIFRNYFSSAAGEEREGIIFLDGFAGSGAMGFEAFSLGARRVYFIEREVALAESLRRNCRALGVRGRVIGEAVGREGRGLRLLKRELERSGERLGLVYLDPPYGAASSGLLKSVFAFLGRNGELLAPGARVVVERPKKIRKAEKAGKEEEKNYAAGFEKLEERSYGKTVLEVYSAP